ncbi:MAG TPA: ribbon-helix-helix domain-containing protein [Longimicrobiaceae bacterium]|jgi:metal-responsive CopG/Arc/MetJ family transcriptional regulator
MRESISISLPEEIKEALDELSEAEGVTRSEVVREALHEYIYVRRLRKLRSRLMPYAEAQGVYTDEDVFREVS